MHRPASAVTVLFVRHAYAGDRDQWEGDDRRRPIKGKGMRQATALVDTLAGYPIARIYSSPFARCVQTVEPLAEARGLAIELAEELGEGRGTDGLALIESTSGVVVLCAHGDNIPDMLDALGLGNQQCKKGATWVVELGSLSTTYLLPPD